MFRPSEVRFEGVGVGFPGQIREFLIGRHVGRASPDAPSDVRASSRARGTDTGARNLNTLERSLLCHLSQSCGRVIASS